MSTKHNLTPQEKEKRLWMIRLADMRIKRGIYGKFGAAVKETPHTRDFDNPYQELNFND